MKKLFVISLILIGFSCKEEDDATPTAPIVDIFDPVKTNATLLKQGALTSNAHTVSGTAKVYDNGGKKYVVLDPFSTQNGPDLKVYLSTDKNASQYINLGPLKSIAGKQSYDVTGMPDFGEYKFVLIWCQQYSVLFGNAEVQ